MGVPGPIQNVLGQPRVARIAVAVAALGLLGIAATVAAPAAQAGSAGGAPRPAQVAAGAAPPLTQTGGAAPAAPAAPAAAPPAPVFGARPPAAPPAPPTPAASPEPAVRVVLAPDARGPLPPAVTVPASQVPPSAVAPATARGPATTPASAPVAGSAGSFSLASMTAPGEAGGAARVEAGPSAALRLTSVAQSQLGARYTWGGTSPATGFDCSGFVYWAYNQIGHPISRVMTEQLAGGRPVRVDELQPGDVLFYQNTYTAGLSHNGIYVGDGRFIHAADESTGVVLTPVHTAYWEQHFAGAIRILE